VHDDLALRVETPIASVFQCRIDAGDDDCAERYRAEEGHTPLHTVTATTDPFADDVFCPGYGNR